MATRRRLSLTLQWEIPSNLDSLFAKYMGKALLDELHHLKAMNKEIGMRYHTANHIVTATGLATRVDILFDTFTEEGTELSFGGTETHRRDYNALVTVLRRIDTMVHEIPEVCKPSALLSTKHYQSPWIQVGTGNSNLLLTRTDAVTYSLNNLGKLNKLNTDETPSGDEIAIDNIYVVGERRMAYKVKRHLEAFSRLKGDRGQLGHAITTLYEERQNSNYAVIVESAHGQKWVYAFAHKTRVPLWGSTVEKAQRPFLAIKHKYPQYDIFGQDLKETYM